MLCITWHFLLQGKDCSPSYRQWGEGILICGDFVVFFRNILKNGNWNARSYQLLIKFATLSLEMVKVNVSEGQSKKVNDEMKSPLL